MNEEIQKRNFKMAAARQSLCQGFPCDTPRASWEAHHVIYQQHIEASRRYKQASPQEKLRILWDPRNAMRLCKVCHKPGQHGGFKRVPLTRLSSENIEFAVELFGAGKAYNYFKRYYTGDDPRVEALIAVAA